MLTPVITNEASGLDEVTLSGFIKLIPGTHVHFIHINDCDWSNKAYIKD